MPVVIFCALNIIFSVLTVPYLRKPLIVFSCSAAPQPTISCTAMAW